MRALSNDLITSQRPHLLIPSHWALQSQHMSWDKEGLRNTHIAHPCFSLWSPGPSPGLLRYLRISWSPLPLKSCIHNSVWINSVCGLTHHPKGCFGSLLGGSKRSFFTLLPIHHTFIHGLCLWGRLLNISEGWRRLALEQATVQPYPQQNPSFKAQCSHRFLLTLGRSYLVSIQFSHLVKLRELSLLGCNGDEVEGDMSWLELYGGFWWLGMCQPSLIVMSAALKAFETSSMSQKTWYNL